MRGVLFLLLVATPLFADPRREYRAELRGIARDAEAYWKGFLRRDTEARVLFLEPYLDMVRAMNDGKGSNPDFAIDLGPYASLYDDWAALEKRRGAAAFAYATSGDERATRTIFGALSELADAIEKNETKLWKNKVSGGWGWFPQEPSVRRHGLAAREEGLLSAIAKSPGAAGWLATKGWKAAAKADGRHSFRRRVMLLDALGRATEGHPFLLEQTRAPHPVLRIAALENAIRHDAGALAPLLDDPVEVVQRALLDAIRLRPESIWIGPVVTRHRAATGAVRELCVRALETLTRQKFGDDAEAWAAWHAKHRAAIEAGTFLREKAEIVEPATREQDRRPRFYGIPTASPRIVFVVDGGEALQVPADYSVQRTRAYWDWVFGKSGWEKKHESHKTVLLREFDRALKALPEGARFGVVTFSDGFKVKTIGERRLLKTNDRDLGAARRFLEIHAPRGYRSELANLKTAMEMAGGAADTIYLHADGTARGGRFRHVEAMLGAFRRMNRFRRVTVHAIQICNGGSSAEAILKGLAEISGGTYVRVWEPP